MISCGNQPEMCLHELVVGPAATLGEVFGWRASGMGIERLREFSKIAPYLLDPLVLVGFGLLLFFSLLSILINSKLITSLRPGASACAVSKMQRYGFMATALTIFLGFWLKADELKSVQQLLERATKTLVSECEATHVSAQQGALQALSASVCERDKRAIRDALSALTRENLGNRGVRALELAYHGDTAEARRIFQEMEDHSLSEYLRRTPFAVDRLK